MNHPNTEIKKTAYGKALRVEFKIDLGEVYADGELDDEELAAVYEEWDRLVRACERQIWHTIGYRAGEPFDNNEANRKRYLDRITRTIPTFQRSEGIKAGTKQRLIFGAILSPSILLSIARLVGVL